MKRRNWIPAVVIAAALIAGLAVASRQGLAWAAQEAGPTLLNPGFEGGFYRWNDVGELEIGKGWAPWWDPALHRPEFKPERVGIGRGRVHSGSAAQKLFTTFSSHDGGLYQEIYGVEPGEWYTFSAWAYQWSSGQDNPDASTGDGKCSALVGINPWGDANPRARTTVWGKEALQIYNQWTQVEVTAQAWSDKIVVAIRQVCEWPVKHNDGYFDDASLVPADLGGEPAPTPVCPTPVPGAAVDYERIRTIVREELDKTRLGPR